MATDWKSLKVEIERLGATVRHLSRDDLNRGLSYNLVEMESRGFDSELITQYRAFNERIEKFVGHPTFGEYLAVGTPSKPYLASGVRVITLKDMRQEISECAPGTFLFPLNYMPFATSIGGNAICFDLDRERVVWADHSIFQPDSIVYFDPATDRIEELPFTPENVASSVTQLHDDFWSFFRQLICGDWEKQLDELD
jgi:hypothetical protein